MTPKVFIVGAGPGRADLITLRAAKILAEAGVVLYDRLVSTEVLDLINPAAEKIYVGKEEGEQEATQARILELLESAAARHPVIVRLKGGDPFVFGRGGEEWAHLVERGIPVEIVPGVSSSLSVPALAGIPATFRGISSGFAVVTGHLREGFREAWAAYAKVDTLIVLMGVRNRASIAQALIDAGRRPAEPACFIENGTTPAERVLVTTLNAIAAGHVEVSSPAVLVIGEVVRLRNLLAAGDRAGQAKAGEPDCCPEETEARPNHK
ncbi:MAG: uroporphyrinogen-III C-methyltransferase [Bryobacteraceae bacterium]|nr:uroporphyrinogen-III C-methyltransferase [Bryobacteraceae bacterium]